MADAILNGDFDEQTGEWLGKGKGFLRSKYRNRYPNSNGKAKKQQKIPKPVFGVINFLNSARIKEYSKQLEIIHEYLNIVPTDYNISSNKKYRMCVAIQKDFSSFVKFVKEKTSVIRNTNVSK